MKSKISYILFLFVLYVFLYNPPLNLLGNLNLSYLLVLVSLFSVSRNKKDWKEYAHKFKLEITIFIIVLVYSVFRSGIVGDFMYIVRHILSVLYIVSVIPFMLFYAKKVGLDCGSGLIRALLIVSSLAACISVLAVTVPAVDDYIRNTVVQYEEDDYLYGKITRGYGIAGSLTSSYGYIQGVMAAIGFMYLKENRWFLLFMPFVLLSALINARTGVLIAFWGIAVLIFSKNKKAIIPAVVITLVFVYNIEDILRLLNINDYTIAWILDFQDQIYEMSSGNISEGAASKLFDRMIVWPSGLSEWLVGKGINLFDVDINQGKSDVGWIIQINYGGLLYVIPLYSAFFVMAKRLKKNHLFGFMLLFIGVAIIVNTKSKIFPTTSFFPFLMLVYVIEILDKKMTDNERSLLCSL